MAQTTENLSMGELLHFPVNAWERHVRVVSAYLNGKEPAPSQKFMRTESRRLAVTLRCKGLDYNQVEEAVQRFVADVGSTVMLNEALRSSGEIARVIALPRAEHFQTIARASE